MGAWAVAGLVLLDISSPGSPTVLGRVTEAGDGPMTARSVDLTTLDGTPYAVVGGSDQGVHVVNVSDPTDPRHVVTASKWPSHHVAALPGTP